jgi:hypothetical protein
MIRCLALLAAVLPVAACTTTYVSPVEVTRFVGDSPARLGSGTIAVRAAPGEAGGSLEFAVYEQAVAAELARLGYRVVPADAAQSQVPGTSAAQVAELRVSRMVEPPDAERSPVNVGVGGSTGSYGSGVGVGVGIDLGGARPRDVIDTGIGLIIRDNATGAALWEGRARFSASVNSDFADRQAAAARLARALFSGFPGESGETIEVR